MPDSPAELASALADVVGAAHVLTDPETRAAYETDWTRRFGGPARLVVRPGSSEQVAAVVGLCAGAGVPVVTQGGNTGLVGGGVPGRGVLPVVLSTARLASIEPPDPVAAQVTAGAGATLARLQGAAKEVGLMFPVDLAARDSATVGGLVATNAGGLHVLRYGSTRAQVVGLEVVLADGSVVSRLGGLVKDNTGYDLSQLMVGSEGTLGIVTAARLRLVPLQPERVVALLGLATVSEALRGLDVLRREAEGLQAAEVFFEEGLDLVRSYSGVGAPFSGRPAVYLLVECAGVRDVSESLFEALTSLGVDDSATAVATDPAGMERLWSYRERHTEAVSTLGVPHKLDVTLPLGQLEDFVRSVRETVEKAAPGARLVIFGHIGDGNLHVNVVGPDPDDESVDDAVLQLVAELGGSISAEHGIGRAKTKWLHLSRSPAELAAMRAVKAALDPQGILNPGVLFEQR